MNYSETNSSGTIANWSLENTYTDSGGNGNTLTPSGTVAFTGLAGTYIPNGQYCAGPFSTANYLNIPSSITSTLFISGTFTVETWINPKTIPSNSRIFYCNSGNNGTNTGSIQLMVSAGSGIGAGSNGLTNSANSIVNLNQWQKVDLVWAQPNFSVYLNGNLVLNAATGGSASGVTFGYIGSQNSAGSPFNGYIKNVRISNYAKSQSDLMQGQPGVL